MRHGDYGGDAVKQHLGKLLRRDGAATYLQENYGFGTVRSLAKWATTGDGPPYRKYGARLCLYEIAELDRWAQAKLSAPRTSTSDDRANRPQGRKESQPSGREKARSRALV